jgi:hypothetical protein
MANLFEQAIAKLREFPEDIQDSAAEHLMHYIDELSTLTERAEISEGRSAFERGAFVPLDQWRHDMGLGHH